MKITRLYERQNSLYCLPWLSEWEVPYLGNGLRKITSEYRIGYDYLLGNTCEEVNKIGYVSVTKYFR